MDARRHIFSLAMVVILTFGLLLTSYAQAAEKPIVLRYAGNFPIKHFMTTMMQD